MPSETDEMPVLGWLLLAGRQSADPAENPAENQSSYIEPDA